MKDSFDSNTVVDQLIDAFTEPSTLRSVLIFVAAIVLAYWLSKFVARGIIALAQIISVRGDNESDETRVRKLRQTETYLSVATAVARVFVTVVIAYIAWRIISPFQSSTALNGVAAIGAGTFFALIAGQTIGVVLRDLTAGTIMITEDWYKIGDFVKLESSGVEGVVERFTLRSTRLRALNGEIIIVGNQSISGVHVTPRGVRTIAVDVFVRDEKRGKEVIQKIIAAIPKGKTMLARPLQVVSTEKWGENRWRITVTGQTAPGREWLIERFFVEALQGVDDELEEGQKKLLVLPPMPRNADETADRRFRRAVRVKQDTHKT